jgi:pimeloyl-ACP methyl ester carboxylesterase
MNVRMMVLAGAWVGWLLLYRPLSVLVWQSRTALRAAGFRRVEVDTPIGRQVAFTAGNGPAVVLLHGAGDQAGTWLKVAPSLTGRHAVLLLDLPGHGGSEPAVGPLQIETIVAGTEAVLERRFRAGPETSRVTLVGNSLGAWVAMLVAHRHPDWVARVVAIDGGALRGSNLEANLQPATREEAEKLGKLVWHRPPKVPGVVIDDLIRQTRVGPIGRLVAGAASMERFVLDGRLHEITAPVNLIWGASDRLVPLDYARRMQTELPGATLTVIPNCGHAPQIECPDQLLTALQSVLDARP